MFVSPKFNILEFDSIVKYVKFQLIMNTCTIDDKNNNKKNVPRL